MNWNEYYIKIAKVISEKSKDPSTKVGCVIVSANNEPISFGYNGFIAKCDEKFMSLEKPQKDYLEIHAEMNALIFAKRDLKGATVYVTHASCENCLKHLAQAGIKKIVYEKSNTNLKFINQERLDIIERILKATGIVMENVNGVPFLEDIKNN